MKTILWFIFLLVQSQYAVAETTPAIQAQKQGFVRCKYAVEKAANSAIRGNEHLSMSTTHRDEPNLRPLTSEIAIADDGTQIVSVVNVFPSSGDKCDVSLTTVQVLERSCAAERDGRKYKNWKSKGEGIGFLFLESPEGDSTAIMMASGTGCVATTTKVLFGIKK